MEEDIKLVLCKLTRNCNISPNLSIRHNNLFGTNLNFETENDVIFFTQQLIDSIAITTEDQKQKIENLLMKHYKDLKDLKEKRNQLNKSIILFFSNPENVNNFIQNQMKKEKIDNNEFFFLSSLKENFLEEVNLLIKSYK